MSNLWSGRFAKGPATEFARFSSSLAFDQRMWAEDIRSTRAHAKGLLRAGLLSEGELSDIEAALDEAVKLFAEDRFVFAETDEDIHSAIERFLTDQLGATGARIHAGRSRNDLVATDLRLWLKGTIPVIVRMVHELQEALYRQSREHHDALMPGYTHVQQAQPILLPHHLLAHAFGLNRDFERLIAAYRRADVSSLGAAALAGTSLPIDAGAIAEDLGFTKIFDNAMDAVSSRDFALEFLSAAAILATNLSRLAEEIVLWTSSEFGFAALDDTYATGSSIMPQKKNPDVAELVRGKSARVTADLMHLLGVMKGLPLAYNRDMQEDKEAVFDAADTLIGMLSGMRGALQTITFDITRMEAAVSKGESGATDLAEALVKKGVPFREAHEAIGRLVAKLQAEGRRLSEVTVLDLQGAHKQLSADLALAIQPRASVASRDSHGGTSPSRIATQFARIETLMDDEERWLAAYGGY